VAPFLILIAKPFLGPWDVSAIYWMECSEIDIARSARARSGMSARDAVDGSSTGT
jgi:hypothetical protein